MYPYPGQMPDNLDAGGLALWNSAQVQEARVQRERDHLYAAETAFDGAAATNALAAFLRGFLRGLRGR